MACDFPSILNGDKESLDSEKSSVAENLLFVEISGGFAGVNQRLAVDEFGRVVFEDSFHPGAKWVVQLATNELDSLVNLFVDNSYFQLDYQHFDSRVADAFVYAISFAHDNTSQTVTTDYFGAPDNLKRIVDGVVLLITRVKENGLELVLELNKKEIMVGEKLDLKLIVTNISDKSLILHFSSGQIFDFIVVSEPTNAVANEGDRLIWNWAHDKVFTAHTWDLILESGENKTYQIAWDSRNNSGITINGEIYIAAQLVSLPGGSSEQQRLIINNAAND